MERVNRKYIDEMNYEELKGWVLEEFIQIEVRIDHIITSYLSLPKGPKEYFFSSIILNSSIISFGSKIKILKNLVTKCEGLKINRECFHRAVNLRNAFAHCSFGQHITVYIKGKGDNRSNHAEVSNIFTVLNNAGILEHKEIHIARDEFYKVNQEIKIILQEIENKVKLV